MTAVRPADSLPPCWRSVNAEWADSAHTASHHSPSPASQSWPPGPVSVRDLHGGPAGRMGELPHQCEETHVAPTPNPLPSCPECTRRAREVVRQQPAVGEARNSLGPAGVTDRQMHCRLTKVGWPSWALRGRRRWLLSRQHPSPLHTQWAKPSLMLVSQGLRASPRQPRFIYTKRLREAG